MDTNGGGEALSLQLSRKGLVGWSILASATVMAIFIGWAVKGMADEIDMLSAAIRTMEMKAAEVKAHDPNEQKILALDGQVQAFHVQAQRMVELSASLMQSAAEMPEFKSPQYKEPYQALSKKIQAMNDAALELQAEVAR